MKTRQISWTDEGREFEFHFPQFVALFFSSSRQIHGYPPHWLAIMLTVCTVKMCSDQKSLTRPLYWCVALHRIYCHHSTKHRFCVPFEYIHNSSFFLVFLCASSRVYFFFFFFIFIIFSVETSAMRRNLLLCLLGLSLFASVVIVIRLHQKKRKNYIPLCWAKSDTQHKIL